MTLLAIVLSLKIAVTLIFVAIPLLLLPVEQVRRLTGLSGDLVLVRLYGVAILALLVGYGFGLSDAMGGWMPTGVMVMGIVSNGGAAFTLQSAGGRHALPALIFLGFAVALAAGLIWPNLAMQQVFALS